MSKYYYYDHASALNRELKRRIPAETLKQLHHKKPWRHFLIAWRQLALLIGLPLLIFKTTTPLIWVPASVLLGFVVFNFTVLLHEVVHKCVFNRDRKNLQAWLCQIYGTIAGLSAAQFTRWHLDHHNQLGCHVKDPKRAELSPKRNARWYKALYCTPALLPIYFAAARRAQADYTPCLRRQIRRERMASIVFHLAILAWFLSLSPWFAVKAYLIPVFFIFPIAFSLNRLGQHYVIDPDDVAKWSTLMRPNPAWNFLFLFSSYHLEHHYYPGVPFYHLKRLQKQLAAFYRDRAIPTLNYSQLIYYWFVRNHKPHTRLADRSGTRKKLPDGPLTPV